MHLINIFDFSQYNLSAIDLVVSREVLLLDARVCAFQQALLGL